MAVGLGNAQPRGRARGRGRSPQGEMPKVNPQGRGMMNPPGQGPANTARGRGQGKRPGIGVGGAALPGPGGAQLARRVQSGKITQEQAQRTMQQRQTLQKAFGDDWRQKLATGAGGQSFKQVRTGLAKSPKSPRLAAINKKLLARRQELLETARKKNSGDGESEE